MPIDAVYQLRATTVATNSASITVLRNGRIKSIVLSAGILGNDGYYQFQVSINSAGSGWLTVNDPPRNVVTGAMLSVACTGTATRGADTSVLLTDIRVVVGDTITLHGSTAGSAATNAVVFATISVDES